MKSLSWPCITCGEDFPSSADLERHTCGNKVVSQKAPQLNTFNPQTQPVDTVASTPLKLEYVYKGKCPVCSATQVRTIELDVAKKHFCVAYCNQCQRQIEEKEVVKL